jgi:hypothetical protein
MLRRRRRPLSISFSFGSRINLSNAGSLNWSHSTA